MRFISRTPVHLALIAISVIWLVPTVGLAITSIRPRDEIQANKARGRSPPRPHYPQAGPQCTA